MQAIILLGGPGAGKGTLAEGLKNQTSYLHVSTGDMLRSAVQAKTLVGVKAKSFMDSGQLVPDDVILQNILRALILGALVAGNTMGSLILTIGTYTTDELSFTISGTLDAPFTDFLAIKNDWSNNIGVHTELFVLNTTYQHSASLYKDDVPNNSIHMSNATATYGDTFYWSNQGTVSAGTRISASVTITCTNGFDPETNNNLQLLSGYSGNDWARLEATAVPEPATIGLLGISAGLVAVYRRLFSRY